MSKPGEAPHYHAYLLRFWEERGDPGSHANWRFSLEDPHTGVRQGFACLEALVRTLQAVMADAAASVSREINPEPEDW